VPDLSVEVSSRFRRERPTSSLLCSLLLFLVTGSVALGQTTCPPAGEPGKFPTPPGPFTHTAVRNGSWAVTTTWAGNSVPTDGAIVCIPANRQVTVSTQEASRLRFIQVNGELQMKPTANTRLLVETLYVDDKGVFSIGQPTSPVQTDKTAELVFISWDGKNIDTGWDMEEQSRGLISMGTVKLYGDFKTHMVPITANALKGTTHLTLDTTPTNWQVGDMLVLTGSYFREVPLAASTSQDEKIKITAISGSAIDFLTVSASAGLVYDHVRPRGDLHLHVADLTRNVVLSSEASTPVNLRGHVMLMNGDDDIENVALVDLGRTDKRIPLDDFVVRCKLRGTFQKCDGSRDQTDYSIVANTAPIRNRRGRYALHFHLNGTTPGFPSPAKVYNSVVNGTVGWGFVSHSSQVDFMNNVAYDFAGAGFVTEAGDELGTFANNIAIRGTGDHEYRANQIVFKNPDRPQPLSDFAFSGDGFWFQGPALQVTDNVAAGCNGAGMIWFTTGQPDVKSIDDSNHNHYTGFPRSAASTVYAGFSDALPRSWSSGADKLVIADLPILLCDGFEGYGNLVGFRLRFNNFSSLAWYGEYFYDADIVPVQGSIKAYAKRLRQEVKNIKVWNNENGLVPNYVSQTDWTGVLVANRLAYADHGFAGADIAHQIESTTFTDLTIDGYEVAGWIEYTDDTKVQQDRGEITFRGGKRYSNYVNLDTWYLGLDCPMPAGVTSTNVDPASEKLSWTADSTAGVVQKSYLVRYQANGDQQWKMVATTETSVILTGLTPRRAYTYQVIAGCRDPSTGHEALSLYTAASTFAM
jgi:hypothetical protein